MNVKVSGYIEDRTAVKNVTMFYQIANRYKWNTFAEVAFDFIKCCCAMVAETENFFQV